MKIKNISKLLAKKRKTGGRNRTGKIVVRHIGGGHKQHIRRIDYIRNMTRTVGTVISIQRDPTKTANIALVVYPQGILSYILAPEALQVGHKIITDKKTSPTIGNHMEIRSILLGTLICNVEASPGKGGIYARSAGNAALLISKSREGYAIIKLPSGEIKKVPGNCTATLGICSNIQKYSNKKRKAGQVRNLGNRPTVRGVAMNPVDHPHGGGEGKSGPGRPSVSYKGIPTKGKKTRKNKKSTFSIVKRRYETD